MNYYEHHIGDYAQATAHLSFIEDAAYSRLIRKYYAEEKNLPADIKSVQRLVGARTKEEREAVANILKEFFTLEADGWHNKRCDAEIAKYQGKQVKARASAQARWDKRKPDAMRTHSESDANASSDNDADAMRTHSEGNAHQSPVTSHQSTPSNVVDAPQSPAADPPENATRQGALCRKLRTLGIDCAPHLQAWATLLPANSDEEIIAAANRAREQKPGERIHLNYLVPILADRAKPRSQSHDRNADRAATVAAFTGANRRPEPEAIDGTATRIA